MRKKDKVQQSGHIGIKYTPYFFIAPYFIVYAVFAMFPIFYSLFLSFTDQVFQSSPNFIGFANYARLIKDPLFHKAIINTLTYAVGYLPAALIVGFLISYALYSPLVKLKRTLQLSVFLPNLVIPLAIGLLFAFMFSWQMGVINPILEGLGIIDEPINWLGRDVPARFVLIFLLFWQNVGYCTVFFLAGLSAIDESLLESAELDGARMHHKMIYIIIPSLRQVVMFLILTGIIGSLQLYDQPRLLYAKDGPPMGTQLGPRSVGLTAVFYIVVMGFGNRMETGYAAAIAYGLFMIIFTLVMLFRFLLRSKDGENII